MKYPMFEDIAKSREMVANFGGLNQTMSCQEGEFANMKNMTADYYPILSPREKRGFCRKLTKPLGILDKEDLMWVDGDSLYKNGQKVTLTGVTIDSSTEKTMAKMGAYVVIFPDKIWYNSDNGECGYIEKAFSQATGKSVEFTLVDQNGNSVTYHDEKYYETNKPKSGDYLLQTVNDITSLKTWSDSTNMWVTVSSTYYKIKATNIGKDFEKNDGVKVTINNNTANWDYAKKLFINDEGSGNLSNNLFIVNKANDYIVVTGILKENKTFTNMPIKVERKTPDLAFITECNNRLWGCSTDGHEIYCCKLGDVKNWNCFMGISTDSYAATVGSDGKFTGAVTFQSNPIFFKEDYMIKVTVSSTGAHQVKEIAVRGVQKGSEKSLTSINEVLYYKAKNDICAYSGSLPFSISEKLGIERYKDAVGGSLGDKYYLSMTDEKGKAHLFCYNTRKGMWHEEDDTEVMFFCKHSDELYYIDYKDKMLKSVSGTLPYDVPEKKKEGKFDWFVESGEIGYGIGGKKYVSRISVRLSLDVGTNVDFYIQYDSDGHWEHKFNMAGKGIKAFYIPVIPKRCDHFKWMLKGNGNAKIISISKTLEEGSDL